MKNIIITLLGLCTVAGAVEESAIYSADDLAVIREDISYEGFKCSNTEEQHTIVYEALFTAYDAIKAIKAKYGEDCWQSNEADMILADIEYYHKDIVAYIDNRKSVPEITWHYFIESVRALHDLFTD